MHADAQQYGWRLVYLAYPNSTCTNAYRIILNVYYSYIAI